MTRGEAVGLGLAPHSGWAVLVGVIAAGQAFRVVVRERVEMTDPGVPGSKQPYHAVEGLPLEEAAERLAGWAATAEQRAAETFEAVRSRLDRDGLRPSGVGILDSAGRKGSSLAQTLASHALIHTADGEHYRAALARGAARCGLPVVRVPGPELTARVASATGVSGQAFDGLLRVAGRELGPPWGADQKSAALLAWLMLSQATSPAP